ncbi:methylenetetrahydrofolate dehydrogenase (NADP+ dependent) 2-like [Chelydra serpentina]|uniref:Methylenetetrahydrofolate dehydrogenase (NADP+ dependent) 2-like n=1 Tax=Chelydra serpentina TaxID=8475 RepID=A0A8T1SA12_CHESE|nr:methylenetetrahydrofolate dehydrogenase (NADP+ dependent) 2-like [Chelydra serpentina]
MVKEGAAVIDVGINHIHDPLTGKTKLVGDVDFEGKKNIPSDIKVLDKLGLRYLIIF